MANDTVVTFRGNLTKDPELGQDRKGRPVATFIVASTPRAYSRESGGLVDRETAFHHCVWRGQGAKEFVDSNVKGGRVIVYGRLEAVKVTSADGSEKLKWTINVEEAGPSNMFNRTAAEKPPTRG